MTPLSADSLHWETPVLHWEAQVALGGTWYSWSELIASESHSDRVQVAYVTSSLDDAWRTFATAIHRNEDVVLVNDDRADATLINRLTDAGYAVVKSNQILAEPTSATIPKPGRVTVLSSGTTGTPKLIEHSVSSLATMSDLSDQPSRTWLVPYAAGTYAWYQLAVMGLTVAGQRLAPVDNADPTEWLTVAETCGVDAVSATPTFWRRALLLIDESALRSLSLLQVTLGGEPIDQTIIDRLGDIYPHARITHIYASSEAGACFAVHDGRAGFPLKWLEADTARPTKIAVRDGMLLVRSPHRSKTQPTADGWIETGDRVEIVGDRVQILGRVDTGFINVGGTKVDAEHVAQTLMRHPSVNWARAYGRRAPVVGQMTMADVVLQVDDVSAQDLVRWATEQLPEAAVPRMINILQEIPTTTALKSEIN